MTLDKSRHRQPTGNRFVNDVRSTGTVRGRCDTHTHTHTQHVSSDPSVCSIDGGTNNHVAPLLQYHASTLLRAQVFCVVVVVVVVAAAVAVFFPRRVA